MYKMLGLAAGAASVLTVLVACSASWDASFDVQVRQDGAPINGVLIAAETADSEDDVDWALTNDRGRADVFVSNRSSSLGPSRVVFAYRRDLGLSVLIEGQDFEWRRVGNASGRNWEARFDAEFRAVADPPMRTCDSDGTLTFELEETPDFPLVMSVVTGQAGAVTALWCDLEDGLTTCPCPDTIPDRAFLVSRSVDDSEITDDWDAQISVDIIAELQLSQ